MNSPENPELERKKKSTEDESLENLSTNSSSVKAQSLDTVVTPSEEVRSHRKATQQNPFEPAQEEVLERARSVPKLEAQEEGQLSVDPTPERVATSQRSSNKPEKETTLASKARLDFSGETILDKLMNFVASLLKLLERWLLNALQRFAPPPARSGVKSKRGAQEEVATKSKNKRAIDRGNDGADYERDSADHELDSIDHELDSTAHERESGFPGRFDDDDNT